MDCIHLKYTLSQCAGCGVFPAAERALLRRNAERHLELLFIETSVQGRMVRRRFDGQSRRRAVGGRKLGVRNSVGLGRQGLAERESMAQRANRDGRRDPVDRLG